jgi:hypothetical protein
MGVSMRSTLDRATDRGRCGSTKALTLRRTGAGGPPRRTYLEFQVPLMASSSACDSEMGWNESGTTPSSPNTVA